MPATLDRPVPDARVFSEPRARSFPISCLARNGLLLLLFFVYAGGLPFLISYSSLLLYGVYLAVGGCAAGILAFEWPAVVKLRSIAPYLGWLVFYCYWGTLVSSPELPVSEVAKTFLKNFLIIGGLGVAVTGWRDLRRLANWIQVAVLVNVGIAIWESSHPELISKIALDHDLTATAYSVLRPAGLWSNPDEASFALIFAFLVCRWASRPLAWAGRAACLAGIFLSASRTGSYVLILCGLVYVACRVRSIRLRTGTVAAALLALAAFLAAMAAVTTRPEFKRFDFTQNWQIQRILDFSEKTERFNGEPKRSEIAMEALDTALDGPWYGHGIFSFEVLPDMPAAVDIGSHNIYLAVLGETGIGGFLIYLGVLAFGLSRLRNGRLASRDRLILALMWMSYLVIGVTWHNQFTSFSGMIYVALLFHLPVVLERSGGEEALLKTSLPVTALCS